MVSFRFRNNKAASFLLCQQNTVYIQEVVAVIDALVVGEK